MFLLPSLQKLLLKPGLRLHFDEIYCRIYFHGDIETVHLDWEGRATTEQFTKACEFALRLLIEKKANKMIADNSKVSEVSKENQDWLVENWFPRAVEKGFRYSAVIPSNRNEVKSVLQFIVNKVSNETVIVQNFNNLSSAKKWLTKV